MALIFPTGTLTIGQTFTNGSVTYTWDGTKWSVGIGTPVDLTSTQTITGDKTFGTMTYTGSLTGSTGIVNIGAGQLYKSATGIVGIGTAAPSSVCKLDVVQSTADSYSIIARINSVQTTAGYNYGILMNNTSATANNYTTISNMDSTGASNAWIEFTNIAHSAATPQGAIGFNTRNGADYTRKMTIDINGNVGIGTASPIAKLNVRGDGITLEPSTYTSSYASGIKFRNDGYAHFTVGGKGSAFVISQTSGGYGIWATPLDVVSIDTAGRVTTPYQPAFHATSSNGPTTGTVWIFNGVVFNIGSYYSTTSGRFTAPVAGTYHFYVFGLAGHADISDIRISLRVNDLVYAGNRFILTKSVAAWQTVRGEAIIKLGIGDTVAPWVDQSAAAFHVDANYTGFGGYLIG